MRGSSALLLCLLAGCGGCTRAPTRPPPAVGAPFPAQGVRNPVAFELALYPTSDGTQEPVAVLQKLAARDVRLHASGAEDAPLPAWHAATVGVEQYGPPLQELSASAVARLSDAERARLRTVKRVSFATFYGAPGDEALLGEARALMEDAARELGALILDAETGEFFSADELHAARPPGAPQLAAEVVVRISGERVVSAGMGKLGLPDVLLHDPRVAAQPEAAHALVDAACQRLRAKPELPADGTLDLAPTVETRPLLGSATTLRVRVGARDPSDAENRLLELLLPGGAP